MSHDPLRAAIELREQLASEKRRLSFFFGAGTSMSVGLPGIGALTEIVLDRLQEPERKLCQRVKDELKSGANIEDILDRIRIYRELLGDSEDKEYGGMKGISAARKLDASVCEAICWAVSVDP